MSDYNKAPREIEDAVLKLCRLLMARLGDEDKHRVLVERPQDVTGGGNIWRAYVHIDGTAVGYYSFYPEYDSTVAIVTTR